MAFDREGDFPPDTKTCILIFILKPKALWPQLRHNKSANIQKNSCNY